MLDIKLIMEDPDIIRADLDKRRDTDKKEMSVFVIMDIVKAVSGRKRRVKRA